MAEIDLNKLNNSQYKFVCELIWGSVPIDKTWALSSTLFKTQAPKLLEKYPMLDKSFFEKNLEYSINLDEDEISEYFSSKEFQESFKEQVELDTWGQGLPMIYMNDNGNIVKHWKDGTIEIIK